MNKEQILNDIKELLSFSKTENFLDAKLNDGTTIVRVDGESFEIGMPLMVVAEEGVAPAPAGEHTLEDGTILVVDDAGLIIEIKALENTESPEEVSAPVGVEEMNVEAFEEASEEVPVEEAPAEEVDKMSELEEKIVSLESQIADLQEVVKEMVAATQEVAEFSKNAVGKINDFVENAPADLNFKAIEVIKGSDVESFKSAKNQKTTDSIESIRNIRKK